MNIKQILRFEKKTINFYNGRTQGFTCTGANKQPQLYIAKKSQRLYWEEGGGGGISKKIMEEREA
jgi:hypothetical protein